MPDLFGTDPPIAPDAFYPTSTVYFDQIGCFRHNGQAGVLHAGGRCGANMSKRRLYQVDAFTGHLFGGNPAAVVPLVSWLHNDVMQAIAAENNVSETAFFVPAGSAFALRWFTPEVEVKLCGHATLATAYVLFTELEPGLREARFDTLSGELVVRRQDERLVMDFPIWKLEPLDAPPPALRAALGAEPAEVLATQARDNLFAVFEDESEVRGLTPNLPLLATLHPAGVVATAPGRQSDCVCRYFAPSYGIAEDPGTGSIHCGLVPYWAERLGKTSIHSLQLSRRGAELFCTLRGGRTEIAGRAVKYLEGWIEI